MAKNSKNIAVSGYYGFDNFGDEAILKVLTSELKNNDFDVTVFSKNPQKTAQNLGVNATYTFDLKGIFKTLKNIDTLISGGGSLLQDVTSVKSLVYYLFVIASALMMRKNVVIFAQGIGPIKNPVCRFLTRACLKKCKYVSVRDAKSKALLGTWGINSHLVSDPVWNTVLKPQVQHQPKRLGLQFRSWPTLTKRYLENLAKCVAKGYSDYEIFIYSFQDAIDLETCNNFADILKKELPETKIEVIKALSIDETISAFAELDTLIAMRYHACLLALKYGIPALALSYDEKVEKIANAFDLPCSFLDENENIEDFIEKLKNLDREHIRALSDAKKFDFTEFVEFCK